MDSSEKLPWPMVVTLAENGAAAPGGAGDAPCGVALGGVRGGAVAVQIGGAAKVSWSGSTAPAPGWQGLACDGQGGVKTVEDGIKFLVLAVDAQARSVVVKL
jgi:hypothetical protein